MVRWVAGFLALGIAAGALWWYEVSGPPVWVLMLILAGMFLRIAMLAAHTDRYTPPKPPPKRPSTRNKIGTSNGEPTPT